MIRRFILVCVVLCMAVTYAFADEQKDITLSDDHNEETVTIPSLCNIFASLVVNDEESGKLTLQIENISEENVILLFGADFNEKYLKRLTPKITYHKIFGGTKGRRTTDYSKDIDGIRKADPSDKKIIVQKEVGNGQLQTIRIPIYIAKYKGKNHNAMELMEKQVVELNIRVELKPDEDFLRLSDEVNRYIEKMESQPICTNKRHRATVGQQKDYYQKMRDGMIERIDSILREHTNWFKGDRGYEKYDSLRVVLQNIDLDSPEYRTANCGKASLHKKRVPPKTRHSCKYCGLSLAQIYHRLDDCYQKIYSSNNRAATKKAVLGEVQALYNCCTDDDCRKHAAEWRKGGGYKSKIVDRYNRINGL